MKKSLLILSVLLLQLSNVFAQSEGKIVDLVDGYYRLLSKTSGKYLDVESGSNENGANVHQWQYSPDADSQIWLIKNLGDGMYAFIDKSSGKYLDVDANDKKYGENGTNVQQWEYAGTPNQKWEIYSASQDNYWFYIVNLATQRCLDVDSKERNDDGGNVQVWDWVRGSDNQIWVLEPIR